MTPIQHQSNGFAYTPTQNRFLAEMLESNVVRDKLVKADLERLGWRVITVWECELREPEKLACRMDEIRNRELQGRKP